MLRLACDEEFDIFCRELSCPENTDNTTTTCQATWLTCVEVHIIKDLNVHGKDRCKLSFCGRVANKLDTFRKAFLRVLAHQSKASCGRSPAAAGAQAHLRDVLPVVSSCSERRLRAGRGPHEMDIFGSEPDTFDQISTDTVLTKGACDSIPSCLMGSKLREAASAASACAQ